MWHRAATALRERRSLGNQVFSSSAKRFQHNHVVVTLQLDYYMSSQFAGVANALVNKVYENAGIDLQILPTCPVGLEQERVRAHLTQNPRAVALGSVEQNVFLPNLRANPDLRTTAVAAMFRKSPLALACFQEDNGGDAGSSAASKIQTIGAHEDTVDLLQRIFPHSKVVASPRSTKNTDLANGTYDAIQVYTTTEVPTLRYLHHDNKRPVAQIELDGYGNTQLGYSQVLFSADECLADDRRAIVQAFLQATFAGWEMSIQNDPTMTLQAVEEAQRMLQLDDEGNDHWHDEVAVEMLERINHHVKETFQGDRYGVIDERRWNEANHWLSRGEIGSHVDRNYGFDPSIWQPPKNLLAGNELARRILQEAKASATLFAQTYKQKPSLAVITVGDLERYQHADRRLRLYSNQANSWFSKTQTGLANGFQVKEIHMPANATTDQVLSQIYSLKGFDGIQLMWPLPKHIDTAKVYNAIDIAKDVDGMHWIGQQEIGNTKAYPPVTAAAVMDLLREHDVSVKGKRVLVIGRSPIAGSPVAHFLRSHDAVVTVAHSKTSRELMKELASTADIIVPCAGSPGVVEAEWIKGAIVVNVGTTFLKGEDTLCADVTGDMGRFTSRYSPVPGGIGPLSLPCLLRNTVRAAWEQKRVGADKGFGWEKKPSTISKTFRFKDYSSAVKYIQKLDEVSSIMDHHANIQITHHCVDGVDVQLEYFTYEAGKLSEKDFDAALVADHIYGGNGLKMSDFSYKLDPNSIAKYPPSPRGSSKLLRVDEFGRVTYFNKFSRDIVPLLKGKHVVFNESRVLDARLYVKSPTEQEVELMLLDLGDVDFHMSCNETTLYAMIRLEGVKTGEHFTDSSGKVDIEVVEVQGVWEEDEESDGNGTECLVRIHSEMFVDEYLEKNGTTPIPPYFHRKAEPADAESYNNVYAKKGGSVAAPTAGLHFTKKVLDEIGTENCSYLSLHVGAGTFKPVLCEDARDHSMHAETFAVSVYEIRNIISAMEQDKPVVVVGTTSTRTLESLYWCGVKRLRGDDIDCKNLNLGQFAWVPLMAGEGKSVSRVAALSALVDGLGDSDLLSGHTSLMIIPKTYEFKIVDHLITNFHAPDSTLMLLVSSFLGSGDKVKDIYESAQANGYRFLSYGDSCFFSRPKY